MIVLHAQCYQDPFRRYKSHIEFTLLDPKTNQQYPMQFYYKECTLKSDVDMSGNLKNNYVTIIGLQGPLGSIYQILDTSQGRLYSNTKLQRTGRYR